MPKMAKPMVKKKPVVPVVKPPAIARDRYCSMLIQVCGWRIVLQDISEELLNKGCSRSVLDLAVKALADATLMEQTLSGMAQRDYSGIKLPVININR